jgi:complement component 1 Q subcomponent-binding protein
MLDHSVVVASMSPNQRSGSRRDFSLSPAADGLRDMLTRERDEEIENGNTEMPPDLKELQTKIVESGWKLVEGIITKLYKTVDGKKIELSFHCQDSVAKEEPYEGDAGEEEDVGDDDETEQDGVEHVPGFRFTLTSTKAGKSLVIVGISENSEMKIESVSVSTEDPEKIHDGKADESSGYQGPEFAELAEDLRNAFFTYAEEDLGLDTNMMTFISMYSDYQEQQNYVKWLDDAKSILL